MRVSRDSLDRALRIMDALLKALGFLNFKDGRLFDVQEWIAAGGPNKSVPRHQRNVKEVRPLVWLPFSFLMGSKSLIKKGKTNTDDSNYLRRGIYVTPEMLSGG